MQPCFIDKCKQKLIHINLLFQICNWKKKIFNRLNDNCPFQKSSTKSRIYEKTILFSSNNFYLLSSENLDSKFWDNEFFLCPKCLKWAKSRKIKALYCIKNSPYYFFYLTNFRRQSDICWFVFWKNWRQEWLLLRFSDL